MKMQNSISKIRNYGIILLLVCLMLTIHSSLATASQKWPGVDESVVEKSAKEHGREAKEPLINTDQGDLLLFVFLLAGAVGGFAAGYNWRILMAERRDSASKEEPALENQADAS